MTPEEEGRKAFMDGFPKEACPYEGKAGVQWKLGYTKEEYDQLREEQASLLESMGFYSDPHTGLEEIIQNVQKSIDQYHGLLRSGCVS